MTNLNPYQPPPETSVPSGGGDTAMEFRGEILRADYVAMLPRARSGMFLFVGLASLLLPVIGIICTSIIVMIIDKEDSFELMAACLGLVVMASILGGLSFALIPIVRARRSLKRHPDLLTSVVGKMDELGVTLEYENCYAWIGPTLLKDCGFSAKGMRIPLENDPYRYLALPARFFDGYHVGVAEELKAAWRKVAKTFTTQDLKLPWQTDDAADPIFFSGSLSIDLPARLPKFRDAAIGSTVMAVILVVGSVFWLFVYGEFRSYFHIGILLIMVGSSIAAWRRYLRGTYTHTWYQAGYLSTDAMVVRNESAGWLLRSDQITKVRVDEPEDCVAINEKSELAFYIRREMMVDDKQWSRLVKRLHQFASKNRQRPADTPEPTS